MCLMWIVAGFSHQALWFWVGEWMPSWRSGQLRMLAAWQPSKVTKEVWRVIGESGVLSVTVSFYLFPPFAVSGDRRDAVHLWTRLTVPSWAWSVSLGKLECCLLLPWVDCCHSLFSPTETVGEGEVAVVLLLCEWGGCGWKIFCSEGHPFPSLFWGATDLFFGVCFFLNCLVFNFHLFICLFLCLFIYF